MCGFWQRESKKETEKKRKGKEKEKKNNKKKKKTKNKFENSKVLLVWFNCSWVLFLGPYCLLYLLFVCFRCFHPPSLERGRKIGQKRKN